MTDSRAARHLILFTIAMTGLAVVVMWALFQVRHILLLVYVSALFAIAFSPLVRVIERQRMLRVGTQRIPRWVAILLIYVVIISALVGLGFAIVPPIVDQAQQLGKRAPEMFHRGQQFLIDRGVLDHEITITEAIKRAPSGVAGAGADAVTTVVQAAVGVAGGIFGLVTILILTFYMLVESESIVNRFVRLFPRDERRRVALVSRDISGRVSAWLGGQILLGAIIGMTATVGLWVIGVPFFFVLGLVCAIGELIPMVGPILSAIPAVAVALTVSPGTALVTALFFLAQQQFENHVLVPKVMEHQVGVSPTTVIIALLVGGTLLGIPGALLAVPTAAALQVIFDELTQEEDDRVAHG